MTDIESMRGLDYRARTNSISLVITRSFVTDRDHYQAIVRVGRQNDKCKRFGIKGISRINQLEKDRLTGKMFEFLKS